MLPNGAAHDPCATPWPAPPTPSVDFRNVPEVFPLSVQGAKSRLPSIPQIPPPLCRCTAAAFSAPYASSRGRPSSPDHPRSAPPYFLSARTRPSSHASPQLEPHVPSHKYTASPLSGHRNEI